MNVFISIIIFLFVLFLYLHITYQYKRSEDLEIFELDYINNKHLQEVCDVKQPVIFDYRPVNIDLFNTIKTNILEHNEKNDVIIKDINDYFRDLKEEDKSIDFIGLPYQSAHKLLKNDSKSHYFTENNNEFIEDSNYYNLLKEMDTELKPSFILQTKYDFCTGSKNAYTPLRYHTNYRQFYLITSGKINVKMTPFKSSKYLYPNKDYENYEFRSPINVWNPQEKYNHEMDKIKFLDFDVLEGFILYIPSYWWFSIKYINEDTNILGLTYNSPMNLISNIPDFALCFIQQHNITTKLSKLGQNDKDENKNNENNNDGEIKEIKEIEKNNDENINIII